MKSEINEILKTYWGYSNFRPLQEDIIHSVLSGRDTLALLPTGGGKSLCFQVPILAAEGVGIVVSPLIALMDDQVNRLRSIGIKAIALNSKLNYKELDLALDNAVNGYYKFLYLSPEKLQNDMVQERIRRMKVNLLAVDEAHCISQWGYDFRPSYLSISSIRELLPGVPVLALTATATPKVVTDIQEKLQFSEPQVFQKTFFRSNLFYNVLNTEKKWGASLDILQKIKGSGIIYTRNRRNTVEISKWLKQNQISADFYHAGLNNQIRSEKQDRWLRNETRIMVCTNAFGMGIDKPDVRLVLHLELPDSLEAYFQEVGRAGRDGQKSYGVMVVDPSDIPNLKSRYLDTFPDLEFIRKVYQALGNYYQLAIGSGENQIFNFQFSAFAKQYSLPSLKLFQALNIMEREGLLRFEENIRLQSKAHLLINRTNLYDYQLRNPQMDPLIKTMMRSYGGLQSEYVSIDEAMLSSRLGQPVSKILLLLKQLKEQGVMDYLPGGDGSRLIFTIARQKSADVRISDENLKQRYRELKKRIEAVCDFAVEKRMCRSRFVLRYFGEMESENCGGCDVCRQGVDMPSQQDFERIKKQLEKLLLEKGRSIDELSLIFHSEKCDWNEVLKWMVDNDDIKIKGHIFEWTKKEGI